MINTPREELISTRTYGYLPTGQEILEFTLRNSNGCKACFINYGGILTSMQTPDRYGKNANITLGYDDLTGYLTDKNYMGALIGRYANRIADGRYNLHGKRIDLSCNDKNFHLHGGFSGFNRIVWDYKIIELDSQPALILYHVNPDNKEGYPGNLIVNVIISLNNENELRLEFSAETDKPSIFNPTHHPYFNLNNDQRIGIQNHLLQIEAREFLPITKEMLPQGKPKATVGTIFDFQNGAIIGDIPAQTSKQILIARGYDHCFVLNKCGNSVHRAASLTSLESGRQVVIYTDAPGIQFYSGNYLEPGPGQRGELHKRHHALCLEPQSFPNSPNIDSFPSTTIQPGKTYRRVIRYQFSSIEPANQINSGTLNI